MAPPAAFAFSAAFFRTGAAFSLAVDSDDLALSTLS